MFNHSENRKGLFLSLNAVMILNLIGENEFNLQRVFLSRSDVSEI